MATWPTNLRYRPNTSPSSPDYGSTDNAFTGEIGWVQLRIGEAAHNR
jgi:hypothetical protein